MGEARSRFLTVLDFCELFSFGHSRVHGGYGKRGVSGVNESPIAPLHLPISSGRISIITNSGGLYMRGRRFKQSPRLTIMVVEPSM